jgi:hypothetical protein
VRNAVKVTPYDMKAWEVSITLLKYKSRCKLSRKKEKKNIFLNLY